MSDIGGYRIGGTIHLIINNQIGFTTAPQYARSSLYCSDVAKTIQAPIFHVNGDDPEACVKVAKLAWEYRQTFHKDVVIDMVCYRRYGHNEGDDPSYTQPLMYQAISERRSVRKLYVETLVKRGDITLEEAEQALVDFHDKLQVSLDETRSHAPANTKAARPPQPLGVLPHIETGVERADARPHLRQAHRLPGGLHDPSEVEQAVRGSGHALRGGRARLGDRRGVGGRFARARRPSGPVGRPGLAPRHVQPAALGAHRLRDRRTVDPARQPRGCRGALLGVRFAAVGVRGDGLRVRLQPRQPGGARDVGGAVRRLRQRRADRHRPVHRRRRGQVGPAERPRAPAAARLRGTGSGAQLGAHRALPHARGRGQHADRQRHDRGELLPPAPSPGALAAPDAADRVHAEAGPAHEADPVDGRRADARLVPGSARRSGRRSTPTR